MESTLRPFLVAVALGAGTAILVFGVSKNMSNWKTWFGSRSKQSKDEPSPSSSPTTQALLRVSQSSQRRSRTSLAQADMDGMEEEQTGNGVEQGEDEIIHESEQVLTALFSIAEDMAKKEGYIHRSITCNHCQTSPIRGIRFKCANCTDFDLCEQCESLNVHTSTHVFIKVRVPVPPLANPRYVIAPMFYPGGGGDSLAKSADIDWLELIQETHFDIFELRACFDQYLSLIPADSEEGITMSIFETCLGPIGLEKTLISYRVFSFFDQDKNGFISFPEFCKGLSVLTKGNFEERVHHAFNGYDLNGDGAISRPELRRMFKAYFNLSIELVRDVVKTMEDGLMESFDDQDAKPVSSVFSAPIVSSGAPVDRDKKDWNETTSLLRPSSPTRSDLESLASSPTGGEASSPTFLPSRLRIHRDFPVMEAMSHQALEEMVEQAFADGGCEDREEMTFEEFVKVAEKDANILSWFEALGSVF